MMTYARPSPRTDQALALIASGKTHQAAANAMGVTKGSVNKLVANARKKLGGSLPTPKLPAFRLGDACPRCGLRGNHQCLPLRAEAYLGRRGEPDCAKHG